MLCQAGVRKIEVTYEEGLKAAPDEAHIWMLFASGRGTVMCSKRSSLGLIAGLVLHPGTGCFAASTGEVRRFMRLWSLIAVILVFPCPGNGQSIHPFYEAKDVAFKPELV